MQKLSILDYAEVFRAAQIASFAFEELKENPVEGVAVLRRFREKIETVFTDLDKRWCALCHDNELELTEWANRMRSVRHHLDEIDRQLTVAQTRLFNWDTAIFAMAYVDAQRIAIDQVLGLNEPVNIMPG